jgi:hypothetical protein
MLRGGCDEVVQWGFDETTLDGQACFNQWCLVRTGTPQTTVCNLGCAVFLCCAVLFVSSCLVLCLVSSSQTVNCTYDYFGTDSKVSSQLVIRPVHRLRTRNKAQDKTRRFTVFKTDMNLVADMVQLRAYKGRADGAKYENMLRTVLGLFGQGIIASLEFTMKDYLQQTRGKLRTAVREDWKLKACRSMLCHNNHAERPFAVLRQYKRLYPSMSVPNLSKVSQSLVNETHRPGCNGLVAGAALTANPRLRTSIGRLCSVRRVLVNPFPGPYPNPYPQTMPHHIQP